MLPANKFYAAACCLLSRPLSDEQLQRLEAAFIRRDLAVPADLTAKLLERGLEPSQDAR